MNGFLIVALIGLLAALMVMRRKGAPAPKRATRQPPTSRRRRRVVVSYEAELAALTAQIERDAARSRWSSPAESKEAA